MYANHPWLLTTNKTMNHPACIPGAWGSSFFNIPHHHTPLCWNNGGLWVSIKSLWKHQWLQRKTLHAGLREVFIFFGGGRGGLSAVVLLGGAVSCQTVVHSLSTRVRRAASICTMITTLHSQQHIPSGPSGELELFSTMAAIISANDWNMSSWGNICCYLRPWQNRGSGRRHGTQ